MQTDLALLYSYFCTQIHGTISKQPVQCKRLCCCTARLSSQGRLSHYELFRVRLTIAMGTEFGC